MPTVARAGPHCGVKDDEVVAHYARAGEASPGVIRIDQLIEGGSSPATPCILRTQPTSAASDEAREPQRRGEVGECRQSRERHRTPRLDERATRPWLASFR